jgi:hypothetical protein
VLRTLSPLEFANIATSKLPFDLHVLSTPPAFVLSQNQTLRIKINQTIADPTDSTLSDQSGLTDWSYLLHSNVCLDLRRDKRGLSRIALSIFKEHDASPLAARVINFQIMNSQPSG